MDSDSISTLRPGSTLHAGTYRIISYIANGGFGITYLAEHTLLEKRVVIKELYVKEWCNRDSRGYVTVGVTANCARYSKLHAKFISEAKVQCHLDHPGVVKVTDVFEENGTAYYVMDFIDGESLNDRMHRLGHGMPEREALGYIRQVCAALAYVHSKGRLHLDIKPGNIMIDRGGHAILIDFGVSKQYDAESGENHSTLLGYTPGYSSPEQKSGLMKHFSPASDIYSLGATLYNLLTGKVVPTTDLRICGEPVPPLPANITLSTRQAIDAALQLPKDRRPQSIAQFLEILDGAPAEAELIEEATSSTPKKSNITRITTDKPNPPKPPSPPRKDNPKSNSAPTNSGQSKTFLWIIMAILLGVTIVVAIILKNSERGNNTDDKVSIEDAPITPAIEPPTVDSVMKIPATKPVETSDISMESPTAPVLESYTKSPVGNEVKWTSSITVSPDGTGKMTFHAKIKHGWHIYAMLSPDYTFPDGCGVPTSVNFTAFIGIEFIGDPQPSRQPQKHFEDVFSAYLYWWEDDITITQKFRLNQGQDIAAVKGYIHYMSCHENGACKIPTKEPFELSTSLSDAPFDRSL